MNMEVLETEIDDSEFIAAEDMSAWMATQTASQTELLNDTKRQSMVDAVNDSNPETHVEQFDRFANGLFYVVDTRPLVVMNWLLAGIVFLLMLNLFINK